MPSNSTASSRNVRALLVLGSLVWFIAMWMIVIALPWPRSLFNSAIQPWPTSRFFYSQYGPWPYLDDNVFAEEWTHYSNLSYSHPDNQEAFFALAMVDHGRGAMDRLETLMARDPKNLPVLAYYLDFCAMHYLDRSQLGVLGRPKNSLIADPARQVQKLGPVLWKKMAAQARRGRALAPNNSYFDWQLALALVQLGQNDAAAKILVQGAHKPSYQDYDQAENLALFHTRKQERHVPPEECVTFARQIRRTDQRGDLYLARRSLVDAMTAKMLSLRMRGRHQECISLGVALTKYLRRIDRDSSSQFQANVWTSIWYVVWGVTTKPINWRTSALPLSNSDNLAGYALAQGNAKTAHQVVADFQALNSSHYFPNRDWYGNKTEPLLFQAAAKMVRWWFNALAYFALISIFGGLLALIANRGDRRVDVQRRDIWLGTLAGFAALPLLLLMDSRYPTIYLSQHDFASAYAAFVGILDTFSVPATYAFWAPGLALLWTVLVRTSMWVRRQVATAEPVSEETDPWQLKDNIFNTFIHRAVPQLPRLSIWGAVIVFVLFFSFAQVQDPLWSWVNLAAVWLLPFLGLWQVRFWFPVRNLRLAWPYFLKLLVRSVGLYIFLGITIIALGSLALTPIASAYENHFERALTKGEIPSLRALNGK